MFSNSFVVACKTIQHGGTDRCNGVNTQKSRILFTPNLCHSCNHCELFLKYWVFKSPIRVPPLSDSLESETGGLDGLVVFAITSRLKIKPEDAGELTASMALDKKVF